jgi:ubiquinone/menaquinone biosynthesis C-methylase UbiE
VTDGPPTPRRTGPPETPEEGRFGFWDVYSRCYDSVYSLMPYRKLLWDSYQALDLLPGMDVLDAGCGTGNFELFLAEKDPPPVRIEAIDFSAAMLSTAGKKCRAMAHVRFRQANLNSALPYPDSTFDRIISINVLYALEDRDRTMREFLRVLKPGGKMIITSPTPEFKMTPLLIDHFGRVRNIWGTRRKARAVLESIRVLSTTGLGSAALNVLVINRRETAGRYRSPSHADLLSSLERLGEGVLREISVGPAMADQNVLATATKAA